MNVGGHDVPPARVTDIKAGVVADHPVEPPAKFAINRHLHKVDFFFFVPTQTFSPSFFHFSVFDPRQKPPEILWHPHDAMGLAIRALVHDRRCRQFSRRLTETDR